MPLFAVTFGLFDLSGWEIILILALVLILFGSKKLPDLIKGAGRGLLEFRKAVDDESAEAGRSLGGIYGKTAAQALTVDNQVAELYDPAVFQKESQPHKRRGVLMRLFSKIWQQLVRFLRLTF
jgi:TatA/E family protein of Tat protein translocase